METERLANCEVCGKLYIKSYSESCMDCHQEIEQEYKTVNSLLKETDPEKVTLEQLSEATGVASKRITEFIREGRIYAADFPKLGYPCAHCGTVIKRQMLCHPCFDLFSSDINRMMKHDSFAAEARLARKDNETQAKYWQLK